MPEGPLEFAADPPRPADGTRFDIYPKPGDPDRGTMVLDALRGHYAVVKNVTDEVGYGNSIANPTAPTAVGARRQVCLNFPRTYGIEFQYRF